MKKILHKISYISGLLLIFSLTAPYFAYHVFAAENRAEVQGSIYEFEENSEYDISSAGTSAATGKGNTLGTFSILGGISSTSTKGGVSAYEVKDGEFLKFSYTYDDTLLTASEDEWHLIDDGKNKVNGVALDDKINYGAIILQTSLDGEKWIVN